MRLTIVAFAVLLAICSCDENDTTEGKVKVETEITKQRSISKEKTEKPIVSVESVKAKGDPGELSAVERENGEVTVEDSGSGDEDGFRDLSTAEVDSGGDHENKEETAENDDENTEDVNEEEDDMENEEAENVEDTENEETTTTKQPKAKTKKKVILSRGVGSLGDMMFQYATVSSIARSSKRKAIFSSAFTPLLTLFPKARMVIIDDEEIVQLQPLSNITLSTSEISFDSVRQDIPDEESVEVVGQTRSFKYFHVILNNLRQELNPAKYYIEAADDYLEEVMRRALKNKVKNVEDEEQENEAKENKVYDDKGFLRYNEVKKKDESGKKDTKENQEETKTEERAPKSILEQLESPGDKITLVGIHVSAAFGGAAVQEDGKTTQEEKDKAAVDYLLSAMNYYRDEHSISGDYVQFVVVCGNLRWCIDHLNGPGVHFAIGGSPELDMSILGRCDHAVLTPSSLSWWSAWLAGGQVVYPATLAEMNQVPVEDYVLPEWTQIY